MSFISIEFALFVCAVVLVYYITPAKFRWWVILLASYIFYSYTGVDKLIYIVLTTISTYLAARLMDKCALDTKTYIEQNKGTITKEEKKAYKAAAKKKQRWLLFACVLINFGILLYMKYVNLTLAYVNLFRLHFFGNTDFIPFRNILLPLGISFYTFQSMGYLVDVYYGKYESEKNPFKYALFVSFFPQIIQGPISRYNELSVELFGEKRFELNNIKMGLLRILWGLFKKLVIADRLCGYVKCTMETYREHSGLYILLAVFFYSMQIYGDFSGGIDVACGVAKCLGIDVTENFIRPFFSKSISEYWQRWHVTLGTWFRDYIFYPLSMNKKILNAGKWLRNHKLERLGKRVPIYVPMIIVWLTTGMWHGSEGRYVVWGLLNCFFVILGTEFEPVSAYLVQKFSINTNGFGFRAYRVIKTFWLMAFLRVFDISTDVASAVDAYKYLFKGIGLFEFSEIFENMQLPMEDFIVAIAAILVLFIVSLLERRGPLAGKITALPAIYQWVIFGALFTVVSVFGYYGPGYDAQAFIYLQF